MPIAYSVDIPRRLLTFVLSGTPTGPEMLAAFDAAVAEAGPGRCRVLTDHRALAAAATTADVMDVVAGLAGRRDVLAGSRCAIVVSRPASYGMMRMFGALAEGVSLEVQVFEDPEDARRWLDVPPPAAP